MGNQSQKLNCKGSESTLSNPIQRYYPRMGKQKNFKRTVTRAARPAGQCIYALTIMQCEVPVKVTHKVTSFYMTS